MEQTHYQVLGVPSKASPAAVRQAYRVMAQRWHPDKHAGGLEAQARFVRIQEAYLVLSDVRRRAQYDSELLGPLRTPAPAPSRGQPAPLRPASVSRALRLRAGDDLHVSAQVSVAQLWHGTTLAVHGFVGVPCSRCRFGCASCGFVRQVLVPRCWHVQLPPAHPPRQWLKLKGMGHDGPYFSGPGDVYVQVVVRSPWGWRWNAELHRLEKTYRLPKQTFKTGGKIELKTPWGDWQVLVLGPETADGAWVPLLPRGSRMPDLVWVRLSVGWWFSKGSRRARMQG